MLVATIITYNDYPLIRDCVESIYDKVDKIIAVDGSYIDFPGSGSSTDGTLEYLDSLLKVEVITTIGLTEIEKRNAYLSKCNDGDVIINLDTDEVLIGEIPSLGSDFGIIDLHDGHSKHVQVRASRFFRFKGGIHYQNTHCTLYDKDNKIINKLHEVINPEFSFENIKNFYLVHNWHLRSHERQYQKSVYYKTLVRKESKFPK